MEWVYYTGVKLSFAALIVLSILVVGCDRGSKPRLIGDPAPDFTVKDSDRTVSLHDLKGKPILLNFWASYCVPCIQEMPSLTQLQRQMGRNLTILAVSVDEDQEAYHKFLRDHQIDLLTVWDPAKKTPELYGTVQFPETYIIDAAGRVRRKIVSAADFTSPEIVNYLNHL
ncbi:MAG TPA: TlpA disulfide reductase family protein [Candidatus Angelobacter sp.]|jgi:peroxiredoxin|nr:TlpA disulfide reductase family protein [Candidatus Angelobacter sp.]